VVQPEVEQHHSNADDPQSSSQARYINETRTLKIRDNLVSGNHETSKGIEEIFINYTSSEKYMSVIQLLQTYASQLSLLKVF
jgi:hypothetical protein